MTRIPIWACPSGLRDLSEENCLTSHDGTQEGEGEAFIVIKRPTEPKTKKAGSDTYPVEEEVEGETEPFLVKGIHTGCRL